MADANCRGIRGALVCVLLSALPFCAHAGLETQIWINVPNGPIRYYDLYVPDGAGGQPWPLVIDMHGFGLTPADQRRRSGMARIAESQRFAVVWPQGGWNSYFGAGGADDVAVIRAMVADIASHHDIDPTRIYATGWSQGGEMAYRLACDASDLIAAVGSVAGGVLVGSEPDCRPIRPVPVISFRGEDDGIVPYNEGWITGTNDKILSATGTHEFWKDINGCKGPDQNQALGTASCATNSNCDEGVRVTSCAVTGGGSPDNHALYSASGVNIAGDSWNFFRAFTLPEVQGGISINPGLTDAWYNPDTAGQGFFIVVLEQTGIVFMAWFTYDTELPPADAMAQLGAAGQRWLTAQGPYEGDTALLDVYNTAGGIFDSPEPAPQTGDSIGTIAIEWSDCENGVLTYDLDQPRVSGVVPIRRIVADNVPLCEALQVK